MECRERVLAALNLEEPDRVPCHTILIDANNVDEILGKPELSDFDLLAQIKESNPENWRDEIMKKLAKLEGISTSKLSKLVRAGKTILVGRGEKQIAIGAGVTTKVNANIGSSPDLINQKLELKKLKLSIDAGSDTVMDLSVGEYNFHAPLNCKTFNNTSRLCTSL